MTAAQLAHLAELAAYAAGFFATTDPAVARLFADTALRADTLSAELRREERRASCGAEPSIAAEPKVIDGVAL
jgi:hypothetical protein